jgi:transcriptional regulator with XRE-family HTH domain
VAATFVRRAVKLLCFAGSPCEVVNDPEDAAMPLNDPNPIDVYVGNRVRMRRIFLGLSQTKLGDALGIAFQQVQKYEKGTNRISASRLQHIAELLQVPVSFFFKESPEANDGSAGSPTYLNEFLATSYGLTLIKAFMQIKNEKLRRRIVDLVQEVGRDHGTGRLDGDDLKADAALAGPVVPVAPPVSAARNKRIEAPDAAP